LNPLKIAQHAIQAVPALKYGLGVLGIVSLIAVIGTLQIDFRIAAFFAVVMFILMTMLVVFVVIAKRGSSGTIRLLGIFFGWLAATSPPGRSTTIFEVFRKLKIETRTGAAWEAFERLERSAAPYSQ
jgi:hypothetical protein